MMTATYEQLDIPLPDGFSIIRVSGAGMNASYILHGTDSQGMPDEILLHVVTNMEGPNRVEWGDDSFSMPCDPSPELALAVAAALTLAANELGVTLDD